ncbi:MAG: hypothetical protein NUW22_02545 [Acidobacteria bacterium]|nr:hypothetical protein [Acidobacteriota bacterium]
MTARARLAVTALAGVLAFLLLATANSGGYRYGVSDQAFYMPAVEQRLTPGLFSRDGALLDAQSRLMASDDFMAAVVSRTGASLPSVALMLYVVTLLLLIVAAAAFGRGLGYSWWAVALFGVLLTFRHRIAKTGANSLEGYMHPRQLAFGVGVAALACVVRGRHGLALALVVLSGVIHPTTALWFGIVVGVAAFVSQPRWRPALATLVVLGAAGALWAVTAGPLAGRLITMDAVWLGVLESKDYLFPAQWPLDAWLLNLAYPVVIVAIWRLRAARGLAGPHERGMVMGLLALVVLFLISVPLTMQRLALAVQLQITRVFWVLDFAALAGVAWWITQSRRAAVAALAILGVASAARGYYLLEVDQPERALVRVSLQETPWVDAMRWLRSQPAGWHVLADPGHAWKYGSSVRVAAGRDTLLESVKDSAMALYSRDVALRVADRTGATADYDQLTTARVRALDAAYDLDAVVVDSSHALDLPLLYRNAGFAIYDVR